MKKNSILIKFREIKVKNSKTICHTYQMCENSCLITPSNSQDVEQQELPDIAGG